MAKFKEMGNERNASADGVCPRTSLVGTRGGLVRPIQTRAQWGKDAWKRGLAAGYCGNNAYLVAGLGGGVHPLQEPYVLAVEVDVDEIAQLA